MKTLLPKRLKDGARIAVVSPAGRDRDSGAWIAQAKALFSDKGYRVFVHPQNEFTYHYFAGTDDERATALNEAFADKTVDAIIAARGGNGSAHILDKLDYDVIRANPKILMGYSDITALHAAIHKNTGLVTFHGPDFVAFGSDGYDEYSLSSSLNLLSGRRTESVFENVQTTKDVTVSGQVIVGNLSLLMALLGTPWEPDYSNVILMIEDIAEELSHLDRMMWQWRMSGRLNKIKALVVGRFSDMKDSGYFPFGLTVNEIMSRHTQMLDIPVITGVSFGHKGRNPAIPYGLKATLTVKGSTMTLVYSGQVVE